MRGTDLHFQNILCAGTVPYLIDLETVMNPIVSATSTYSQASETREGLMRSPIRSLLMPARVDDMEISALMNTDESGVAPVVDGHVVDVRPYLREFKEGYHGAYVRAVEQRDEIREALRSFDPDATVRVVLRPTYGDDTGLCGLLGRDATKCRFFDGGWYEKVTQALSGWQNLSDIGCQSDRA